MDTHTIIEREKQLKPRQMDTWSTVPDNAIPAVNQEQTKTHAKEEPNVRQTGASQSSTVKQDEEMQDAIRKPIPTETIAETEGATNATTTTSGP